MSRRSATATATALATGLCIVASITATSSGVAAEDVPTDPVRCATQMSTDKQAGQTLLALASDSLDQSMLFAQVEEGRMAGFAPVGDFVDGVSMTVMSHMATLEVPGLFASDEEGGVVQRFRNVIAPLDSARVQAETLSPAEVTENYRNYGNALESYGVTMAFAPVVDVEGGPAIGPPPLRSAVVRRRGCDGGAPQRSGLDRRLAGITVTGGN